MTSAVALAQGLPLWAMRWAFLQNPNSKRFPDGIASRATPNAGCARARSSSTSPPSPTREELSPPIPKRSASRPAIASDVAGLVCRFLPARLFPAVLPATPTRSATPTTARAIAADFAIHSRPRYARSGRQSRARSLQEPNADKALQRSPSPHTTATDAANPVIGSSCDHSPGTDTGAPISQSIPRPDRGPDGSTDHAPAPSPVRHRVPFARIAHTIAAEVLQPMAHPLFGRRGARRKSQGCVE